MTQKYKKGETIILQKFFLCLHKTIYKINKKTKKKKQNCKHTKNTQEKHLNILLAKQLNYLCLYQNSVNKATAFTNTTYCNPI